MRIVDQWERILAGAKPGNPPGVALRPAAAPAPPPSCDAPRKGGVAPSAPRGAGSLLAMAATVGLVSLAILLCVLLSVVFDVYLAEPGRSLYTTRFRLRRLRNWLPMGLAYCAFYCARYNIAAANTPTIESEADFPASAVAGALSLAFWAYAATSPFSGAFADRRGGRGALLLACTGSAAANVLAAAASRLLAFDNDLRVPVVVGLFAVNVVAQGFGTSAVVRVNAGWYGPRERGVFGGIFSVMVTSGYYAALGGGTWVATHMGLEGLFLLPAAMLAVAAVLIAVWSADEPEPEWNVAAATAGRGVPAEGERSALLGAEAGNGGTYGVAGAPLATPPPREAASSALPGRQLASDGVFLCYCVAIFFLCWVRDGLISWLFGFLEARRGEPLDPASSALVGGGVAIGGFVGGVIAGGASDYCFRGSRSRPILGLFIGQLAAIGALYQFGGVGSAAGDALNLFVTSFFVCGNYALLSYTVPSDLEGEVVATAAGIMTAAGYVASGLAGVAMEGLIAVGGFGAWALSLAAATCLAALAIAAGAAIAARRRELEDELEDEQWVMRRLQSMQDHGFAAAALDDDGGASAAAHGGGAGRGGVAFALRARRRMLSTAALVGRLDGDVVSSGLWPREAAATLPGGPALLKTEDPGWPGALQGGVVQARGAGNRGEHGTAAGPASDGRGLHSLVRNVRLGDEHGGGSFDI